MTFDYSKKIELKDIYLDTPSLSSKGIEEDCVVEESIFSGEDSIENGDNTLFSKISDVSDSIVRKVEDIQENSKNNKYEELRQNGASVFEALKFVLSPNNQETLEQELSMFEKNPNYEPIKGGMLDRIGKPREEGGIDIVSIDNVSKYFDKINDVKYGERIDESLENWTVNIGGSEVKIRTDNNIIMQENITLGLDLDNIVVITQEEKDAIEESFEQMLETGQDIPEEVFITGLLASENTAGVFYYKHPDAITINSSQFKDIDYFQEVIYHESAHMEDLSLGEKDELLSETKSCKMNSNSKYVGTSSNTVRSKDIGKFISKYALTNEAEFVAETTALITNGTICLDTDDKYTIVTDRRGYYENAKDVKTYYDEKHKDTLNDIMSLYMELTEGKIATPLTIDELNTEN